jgi:hypothetical protein
LQPVEKSSTLNRDRAHPLCSAIRC